MALIEINKLKKSFGELEVLRDVSFQVEKGDVVAVLGTSGSGKSTLLRSLINLEQLDGGSVSINSEYLIKDGKYANQSKRQGITSQMGMVFQNFNLFPHLTVRQNLEMPAKFAKKLSNEEITAKADELLKKVGLFEKADVKPNKLSGGQKQRVAIARALMLNPTIMLFDEPTSALDPQLTGEVLSTMRKLAEEHMTMIVVTHEMGFARDVANRIIFMSGGEIVEEASPDEFFKNPKHPKAREFLRVSDI